jgi:hypothetical protein
MEKLVETLCNIVAAVLLVVSTIALAALLNAFPIKWAWNCAMPALFGFKEIGFWEAFSLSWLASAFFKASAQKEGKMKTV